jgi:hypothetical protein
VAGPWDCGKLGGFIRRAAKLRGQFGFIGVSQIRTGEVALQYLRPWSHSPLRHPAAGAPR